MKTINMKDEDRSGYTEAERGSTKCHRGRRYRTLWNSVQPLAWLCGSGLGVGNP